MRKRNNIDIKEPHVLSLIVEKDTAQQLKYYCSKKGVSMNAVLVPVIHRYIKALCKEGEEK